MTCRFGVAFIASVTAGRFSATDDVGLPAVLGLEEKGSMRPELGNAASWPVFWPEGVSHMAVSVKLDEQQFRKAVESWADSAEYRNWRRLPHNSGFISAFWWKRNPKWCEF